MLQIALGDYSSPSHLVDLIEAIEPPSTGRTNIIEAVELTLSTFLLNPRLGDPNVRFAAIFITDGEHNYPKMDDPLKAIENALLPIHVLEIATMSIGKVIFLYKFEFEGFIVVNNVVYGHSSCNKNI